MFFRVTFGLALVILVAIVTGQQRRCSFPNQLVTVPNTGCHQFYICTPELAPSAFINCPSGTLFDERNQTCAHVADVTCPDLDLRAGGCSNRFVPVPNTGCRNFSICILENVYTFGCGEGTIFSPSESTCTYPYALGEPDRQACGLAPSN